MQELNYDRGTDESLAAISEAETMYACVENEVDAVSSYENKGKAQNASGGEAAFGERTTSP